MHPAIRVDGISKLYRIGERQRGYRTLRETLVDTIAAPWRRARNWSKAARKSPATRRLEGQDFWALRDVSFTVNPGDIIGIIGRNGAGKSTLLKILSRITEPTDGRIELRGRVGSLLEVGTGFHAELTGRENIFMNGSILGMTRREIRRKFDEIVAFSEIDDFLDTPVKRYSSGMYVRLAFSVAAHLEPEILIVDEVLAVGDQAFQSKCMQKMETVRKHGRTILFVSHNMMAVQRLCTRAILLDGGEVTSDTTATAGVAEYHKRLHSIRESSGHRFLIPHNVQRSHPSLQVKELRVTSGGELNDIGYSVGDPLDFEIDCDAKSPINSAIVAIHITRVDGPRVTTLHSRRAGAQLPNTLLGPFTVRCSVRDVLLPPGDYSMHVIIKSGASWLFDADGAGTFRILPTDIFKTGINPVTCDESVLCWQDWSMSAASST